MGKTVFTNGCFDVIHPGHVDLLRRARELGDKLIVGINSDNSVRSIKGLGRPYFLQDDRRAILLGLKSVDEVHIFEEATPEQLIRSIAPDVLVKGGDWKIEEIIGAEFVLERGGEVRSLPLVPGYSSTDVIEALRRSSAPAIDAIEVDGPSDIVADALGEHLETFHEVLRSLSPEIRRTGDLLVDCFRSGGKVLICGNGGSAADSQHIAAEFVGRYETERLSLPAIALTTDTSSLTAIGNDFGFERIFARQIQSLASEGDCLIAISTSGNSPNVIAAVMEARRRGAKVIGLTGAAGKKLASLSDASVLAPSKRTARIQEVHLAVIHIWCEMVDAAFAESE